MTIKFDVFFGGEALKKPETEAPYNNKFGKNVATLEDAIKAARAANEKAHGKTEGEGKEDVAVVHKGDNLWDLWKEYGEPKGESWKDFKAHNRHLQDPTNLGGNHQAGWKDYWLVHQGDVVFVPKQKTGTDAHDAPSGGGTDKAEGPSPSAHPATITDNKKTGELVNKDGKWMYRSTDYSAGRPSYVYDPVEPAQNLTYKGVKYYIYKVEGDSVWLIPPDGPKTGDQSKDAKQHYFNEFD